MNTNERALSRAVAFGIAFGFAALAILGALFDIVDDETALLFVPIVLMLATVFSASLDRRSQ